MLVICVSHRIGDYLVTKDAITHDFKLCANPWVGFGNPVGDALTFTDLFQAEVVLNIIKLKIKASQITIKDIDNGREV